MDSYISADYVESRSIVLEGKIARHDFNYFTLTLEEARTLYDALHDALIDAGAIRGLKNDR